MIPWWTLIIALLIGWASGRSVGQQDIKEKIQSLIDDGEIDEDELDT